MLMLVGESARKSHPMGSVARELSLSISAFNGTEPIKQLLRGHPRCIVFLGEGDFTDVFVSSLEQARGKVPMGVVFCGDRDSLRGKRPDALCARVDAFENVEWAHNPSDVNDLCDAARRCRERLLEFTQAELDRAINQHELVVQYQPKVERGDGSEWVTREAEALIRWRHPERGLLESLQFLPELDVFGLISRVGIMVLKEVSAQIVIWRAQRLELNACINLASSLLRDENLPDLYEKIVKDHGLKCEDFTFEIIEQEVANSDAPHLEVLKALRDKGFRISLDDFGVAVTSLGTFEQLPFDEIKIHGAVVTCARSNPVAKKVLAAVTGLAHNLGISVCAEGVEDEATYEFLKTIQCDKMQGFLVSEAVMPEIVRRVYSNRPADVEDVA